MVAPGYFAKAAACTLVAVSPVNGVSPACPLFSVSLVPPVTADVTAVVAAPAEPVDASTAPPPKPARTSAPAAAYLVALVGNFMGTPHGTCRPHRPERTPPNVA